MDPKLKGKLVGLQLLVLSKARVCILSAVRTWLSGDGMTVKRLLKMDDAAFEAKEKTLMKKIEIDL